MCGGAMMMCSFGTAPSTLNVLPVNRVMAATPMAGMMDQMIAVAEKNVENAKPLG